jgi:hypothetical protein
MLPKPKDEDLEMVRKALLGGCACGKCALVRTGAITVLSAIQHAEDTLDFWRLAEEAPERVEAEQARNRQHHAEMVAVVDAAFAAVQPTAEDIAMAAAGRGRKH